MLHYERLTSTLQENVCELTEEKYQKKMIYKVTKFGNGNITLISIWNKILTKTRN